MSNYWLDVDETDTLDINRLDGWSASTCGDSMRLKFSAAEPPQIKGKQFRFKMHSEVFWGVVVDFHCMDATCIPRRFLCLADIEISKREAPDYAGFVSFLKGGFLSVNEYNKRKEVV